MELHPDEAPELGRGDDALRRRGRGRRVGRVGVGEVELLAARLDRRPADAGNAPPTEPHGASWEEGKSTDAAVFVRRLECQVEAQADPERRLPYGYPLAESVVERAGGEAFHGGA